MYFAPSARLERATFANRKLPDTKPSNKVTIAMLCLAELRGRSVVHTTRFLSMNLSMLFKSYQMVRLLYLENDISALFLSFSNSLSLHPKYAIASLAESHSLLTGSTFPTDFVLPITYQLKLS